MSQMSSLTAWRRAGASTGRYLYRRASSVEMRLQLLRARLLLESGWRHRRVHSIHQLSQCMCLLMKHVAASQKNAAPPQTEWGGRDAGVGPRPTSPRGRRMGVWCGGDERMRSGGGKGERWEEGGDRPSTHPDRPTPTDPPTPFHRPNIRPNRPTKKPAKLAAACRGQSKPFGAPPSL